MSKEYIVKLKDTPLWLIRHTIYSAHFMDNNKESYTLTLSSLLASRFEDAEEAIETAKKGIPTGYFDIYHLRGAVVPVVIAPVPEPEVYDRHNVVNCGHLCGDKKHWWCRWFSC